MTDPLVAQRRVRRLVRRRRLWRVLRLTFLSVVVLVLVSGAGYGIDRLVAFVQRLEAHSRRAAGLHSTTTTTVPATTTTTFSGPPRCVTPQLAGHVYNWQVTGGSAYEIVELSNISPIPCTLSGYAGIGASTSDGTSLPVTVHDTATLGAGAPSTTTTAAPVVMNQGSDAWFELSYPETCDTVLQPGQIPTGSPNECYEGSALQVIPPQASSAIILNQPLRFAYSTSGLAVGPFFGGQPPSFPPVSG